MEHLPECEWNDETRVNRRCICPALRACEARVDKAWHEYDQLAREGAYLSGVQAARDAVAARESQFMRVTESDRDSWACRIYGDALAAIDALKEDK